MLIHPQSLSLTVNAVNDAFFFGTVPTARERTETARWIAARHGQPGAYGKLFGGFPSECASGIRVFTGERITSASARHILGEEACRALLLLGSTESSITTALTTALSWLSRRLEQAGRDSQRNCAGLYCCGKCSVGLWRNVLAGGLDRRDERLGLGLRKLRTARDGEGGWKTFPFWYTVLALTEMDLPAARAELRYAAPQMATEAKRKPGTSPYAKRRNALARRAIGRV